MVHRGSTGGIVAELKYRMDCVVAISNIAKMHAQSQHPAVRLWTHPQTGVLTRIRAEIVRRGVHPARALVLLPYAQLLPVAQDLWAQCYPDGFAPRFETVVSASRGLGLLELGAQGTARDHGTRGPVDICFEQALDGLTAHALLAQAGVDSAGDLIANVLVQAVYQLAPLAASIVPAQRAQWVLAAQSHLEADMHGPAMAWEALLARVALQWAGASHYSSDWLWSPQLRAGLDCLIAVQGFSADPLLKGLQHCWGDAMLCLPLALKLSDWAQFKTDAKVRLHACLDSEDEALHAAACAIRHIEAGQCPVALVSSDRALTRRIRALLECAGVSIRDENGWKLSTTNSAAHVMSLLKACVWDASSDAVLDWLKSAPLFAGDIVGLEAAMRRAPMRDWRGASKLLAQHKTHLHAASLERIEHIREQLQSSRTLLDWLSALRTALQRTGAWDALQADAAGVQVLGALRLSEHACVGLSQLQEQALWRARRMPLGEFIAWVNLTLEQASFKPAHPAHAQVVIAPMNQILARPFAALVLVGCDEVRLNPSPDATGVWTPAQRAALGLPSRESLAQTLAQAWQHALQTPVCDVLWRSSDDAGEVLLPSPLVQLIELAQERGTTGEGTAHGLPSSHPLVDRRIAAAPVAPPLPQGHLLGMTSLSASAYDDLRQCPYRFFALRLLNLKPVEELDAEVGKRDFGLWLHEVLKQFHEALALKGHLDRLGRQKLLDELSSAASRTQVLAQEEFLPFAAAWPAVREGYLTWLEQHEKTGAVFSHAEAMRTQTLEQGALQLVGRLDRIDSLPGAGVMVLDYKTESATKTAARVKEPFEDTQMAFYAALMPHNSALQAAYVSLQEQGTKHYPQAHIVQARDAFLQGMVHDMQRVAQGAVLPALGDASACDFCHARGLCRKDFWTPA